MVCEEYSTARRGVCGRALDKHGQCDRASDHGDHLVASVEYAEDRDESESCEAGTAGCSIDHTRSSHGTSCEGW